MNSIFGMFIESRILRVSCKVGFKLHLQETRSIHDSMHIQKMNLLLIFEIYYKYLKYKNNIFDLGIKTVLHLKYNRINGLVGEKNEKAEQLA